ncbi:MarR family winged helix-turn-helix transcriptional regulator [Oceanibacterium hippocampi]|uniref:Multiple antibiotic resistance protein MarR n=1 Tax=Oceanibacterium hippocampi TaxID=745714 RepID=A0A1Y5TFW7_9PROT|nr:MarR family transcriptional regulator [Oceanibacterium hippocampi]SLN60940.1 Multiple antibiotic resistance protein MarR [Oceanibacterium hippocampi]
MANDTIADYLVYQVARAHRRLHGELDDLLQEEGVQVEHWRVLDILSDGRGRSMGELASLVLMNHPALTKMLDKMVSNALVHRLPDINDARRVLVFITESGRALHDRIKEAVDAHDEALNRKLGKRDVARLKQILDTLDHAN